METKVETVEENQVKVTVTVPAADIDARIKKAYREAAGKYSFPGFRKGKAPRKVVDNALGADYIRATVTDDVVNDSTPLAIDDQDLRPVGQPEFDDVDIVVEGEDYTFTFTLTVEPQFELTSYDPVTINVPPEGASDDEIQIQIEALQEHYFTYENANANTKIKADSSVELNMKAFDDAGEPIDTLTAQSRLYTVGSGLLPETFDAEIVGLKKGQTKEFTIALPEEPTAYTATLTGKTENIKFEVEVVVVKKKVLPEVNDQWAHDGLGFENLEDLRSRIAESIVEQKEEMLPRIKENQILDELGQRLDGTVDPSMTEETEAQLIQEFFGQLQRQGLTFDAYLTQEGLTPEQFKEDVKKQAMDMFCQDLALDAWARHFELGVTDEEVMAEFEKSGAANPKALYKEWREAGRLHLVRSGILRTKAVLDCMEKANLEVVEPDKKPKKAAK